MMRTIGGLIGMAGSATGRWAAAGPLSTSQNTTANPAADNTPDQSQLACHSAPARSRTPVITDETAIPAPTPPKCHD